MDVYPFSVAERSLEGSVHGHRATVLIVAARSATVYGQVASLGGQAATVLTVAVHSATVGTVAKKDGTVTLSPHTFSPFIYISHASSDNQRHKINSYLSS